MEIDDAIKLLSETFNIRFSEEQINILKSDPDKPLLVNACAGSGKTTLYLISIMLRALIGNQEPEHVLGITFSKKAQLDMEKRYEKNINKLATYEPSVISWGKPTFCTFHALFLRLLKKLPEYKNVEVLNSWHYFFTPFSKHINLDYSQLSTEEYLENIFNCYERMINFTYSLDGLRPNMNNKIVKSLLEDPIKATIKPILEYEEDSDSDKMFCDNYMKVITLYHQLKKDKGAIDFNDMKLTLLSALEKTRNKVKLTGYMKKYTQVYIDEFQDIDPLQWILIKELVDPATLNRLFVIGDDDQSIYSFRGSSPYYITHFAKKLMPNAIVLNLSTNYRTDGKILRLAKPMIEENQSRLGKTLSAFNEQKGKIKFISENSIGKSDVLFKKLLRYVRNPLTRTAVLVRFNRDKTILADKLASMNYYVNVGQKSMIFQNTPVYKMFVDLVDSILNNDAQEYIKHANNLGFGSYQNKLCYAKKKQKDNNLKKLMESVFENMNVKASKEKVKKDKKVSTSLEKHNLRTEKGLAQDTLDLLQLVEFSKHEPEYRKNELTKVVFGRIKQMTNNYFKYMYSKNVYSKATTLDEILRLNELIEATPQWDKFKKVEECKKKRLEFMIEDNRQMSNLQLLTMHQSKGLEFDTVFLYGLTDDVLNKSKMKLNKRFSPDISSDELANELSVVMQSDDNGFNFFQLLRMIRSSGVKEAERMFELMLGYGAGSTQDVDEFIETASCDFKNFGKFLNLPAFPLKGREFKLFYYQLKNVSAEVEEERRLLYVAITRAKKRLYVGLPTISPSPLVIELQSIYGQMQSQQVTKYSVSKLDKKQSSDNAIDIIVNDLFGKQESTDQLQKDKSIQR